MSSPAALAVFKHELDRMAGRLEQFTGRKITGQDIRQAIRLHNEKRSLLREVYSLRKEDPPPLSGSEMMYVLMAVMSIPVEDSITLLQEVLREIKGRPGEGSRKARLMVYGGPLDSPAFINLIEQCGAVVVMDDTCIGTRQNWHDVIPGGDPMESLALRYLTKITCPRPFKEGTARQRLKYLQDYAGDFNVDGVILYSLRYCDMHAFDLPDIQEIMEDGGYPVLSILDDYDAANMERLRTRIQAFIETLG
jgi:benzoyl-CoA reductase/2-hydroxyglutaryl-CoA dehydratase subunit BcrC/BadD/HgdB